MSLLEIRNATAYRGATRVFDQLNLQIQLNRGTAILGPNGAGKTTLLKLISREIYPVPQANSYVRILGHTQWNVWDLREQLGLVSLDLQQNYSAQADGYHVVASGFFSSVGVHQRLSDQQSARVEETLTRLAIGHLRKKPFTEMSTGEQRRCLLARAMINRPAAFILDEPTTGLDVPGIFGYLETVEQWLAANKTVVVVTHHLHEISPAMKHVVLLKQGRVLAAGPKVEMLTDERLSELYGCAVRVIEEAGYYRVIPG